MLAALIIGLSIASVGCEVDRTITVQTDPPGALVYLNDVEIGRTPVTRPFKWYGTYDVEIRKEGFVPIKTTAKVWAPWWGWPPIDFATSFVPNVQDHRSLSYALELPPAQAVDPEVLVQRGERTRTRLESGVKPPPAPPVNTAPPADLPNSD
jgi:hypothetical protein